MITYRYASGYVCEYRAIATVASTRSEAIELMLKIWFN